MRKIFDGVIWFFSLAMGGGMWRESVACRALGKACLLLIFALFAAGPGQAASFDCTKAATRVEKLICEDAELSKLDEELAEAYKTALHDEAQADAIRQAQRQWPKKRDACADAGCVKLAYTERLQELSAEPKAAVSKLDKPRFTVTQGKGWTVCESYAKFLNTLPESEPLPLCHLKLSPDFPDLKEPDWEELDIAGHIELVYSLEKLTSPTDHNRPVDNFELWQAVFEQQIKSGEASPRLRRVRLALVEGSPVETILAYEPDRDACDKEVKKRGYANYGARTRLFLWDEQEKKIREYASRMAFFGGLPQQLLIFQGRPFTFLTFWGGRKSPGRDIISGEINVRHFTDKTGDVTPYANLQRCQIGCELTSEISKRILK